MADTLSTTSSTESLAEAAGALGASLVRTSFTLVTLPLSVLPVKPREEATAAVTNLFKAVGDLHLSVLKTAVDGVGSATRALKESAELASSKAAKNN